MRRSDPYEDVTWDENGVLDVGIRSSLLDDGMDDDDGPDDTDRLNNSAKEVFDDDQRDLKTSSVNPLRSMFSWWRKSWRRRGDANSPAAKIEPDGTNNNKVSKEVEEEDPELQNRKLLIYLNKVVVLLIIIASGFTLFTRFTQGGSGGGGERPAYVFEHPYISSSYYTSTKSISTLEKLGKFQVQPKKEQLAGKEAIGEKDFTRETQTRLAILRPFCAFDAGPLPTTFDCWQNFPPCRAAAYELGEELDPSWYDEERYFDDVGSHMLRNAKAGAYCVSPSPQIILWLSVFSDSSNQNFLTRENHNRCISLLQPDVLRESSGDRQC